MSHLIRKDLVDVNGVSTHRMTRPQVEASEATRAQVAAAAVPSAVAPESQYAGVQLQVTTSAPTNPHWIFSPENAHDVTTTLSYEGRTVTFPATTQGINVPNTNARDFLADVTDTYVRYLNHSADGEEGLDEEAKYYLERDAQTAEAAVQLFGWDHSILRQAATEVAEDEVSPVDNPDLDWLDDGPLGTDPEVEVGQDFTYEGMLVRATELHADKRTLIAEVTNPGTSDHPVGAKMFVTADSLDEAQGIETEATRDYASIAEGNYLQAAVEGDVDGEGTALSDNYDYSSFDEDSVIAASNDLRAFVARHYGDLHDMDETVFAKAYFGSRMETSAGFWEMGDDPKYKRLDEAARADGGVMIEIDDDGETLHLV